MSKTVLKWMSLPKRFKRPPDSRSRIAFVDAGYTGDAPAEAAKEHGIRLEVVKLEDGETRLCPGFRDDGWSNATRAWTTRFRRLVRDYERLPAPLAGLHLVVFACLMLHHWMAFSGPTSRHVQEQETPVRRSFREHPIDLFYLQFTITP